MSFINATRCHHHKYAFAQQVSACVLFFIHLYLLLTHLSPSTMEKKNKRVLNLLAIDFKSCFFMVFAIDAAENTRTFFHVKNTC